MLLPLHDDNPLRRIRFGWWTVAIIAACALVFLYQMTLPEREALRFVHAYGAIPAVVFGLAELPPGVAQVPANLEIVTSMFLHGSFAHLFGNMLFLWVLGDNVEDALGHARFVVFYLLSGIAAALSQLVVEPASTIPMIGASAAISEPGQAGVAWWAHIGGFFAGAILIVPMRQRGVPLFDQPE